MNLLSIEKRISKITGLFLILSINVIASSNDSIPIAKFKLLCEKSDAYYIHRYEDVSYQKSWSKYEKITVVNSKLVVNTTGGVEKYAFLKLSDYISNHIKQFEIKTLKADGSVVKLDSSKVFNRNTKSKFDAIDYPIPGVEPGDTIVTIYSYNRFLEANDLSEFVDLNSTIPTLLAEYTVRSEPKIKMRYKTYNDFPEPEYFTNDTILYCAFKEERKEAMPENEYACYPCELPYVYFSLDKPEKESRTWKDVYNEEFNAITQPIRLDFENSSYYKRWRRRVLNDHRNLSKYKQLDLLINEVYETMEMEPAIVEEIFKSNGYFLKDKRLNPFIIRRLYRQFLEDLEIDYWAVFARSKRSGPIDPYFIRKREYDHIFFAYKDGDGKMNFLYPNEASYKYYLNEIPTSIFNTTAVIVRPENKERIKRNDKYISLDFKMAEVDAVEVKMINLPKMNINKNYVKQIYYCDVNMKAKKTLFKHRYSVSGGMSTDLRRFYSMLNKNEEAGDYFDALLEFEGEDDIFEIDSVHKIELKSKKPFHYTIMSDGRIEGAIKFISDSIVSISLEDLIQHSQVENESDAIGLDTYLDYTYSDFTMYIMNFQNDIEVLGFDESSIGIENEYAMYHFDIKMVGTNKINIQSNYVIQKDMILKEDYEKVNEVNQLLKELRNKRLLLKLKSS